jgi:hypothetical protein
MWWISPDRRDVATVASVALSVATGVVGNYLVASWFWGLAACLVVLVASLAGLEVLRRRLDRVNQQAGASIEIDHDYLVAKATSALRAHLHAIAAGPQGDRGDELGAFVATRLQATASTAPVVLNLAMRPDDEAALRAVSWSLAELLRTDRSFATELSSQMASRSPDEVSRLTGLSPTNVAMIGRMRSSVIATGNVDQSRRSIRIGGSGILVAAVLLGSGVIGTGRIATDAGGPENTTTPPTITPPAPKDPSLQPYESSAVFSSGFRGEDFDKDGQTKGLDDATFHKKTGLVMLNNAGVAELQNGHQFSRDECGKVPATSWRSQIEMENLRLNLQLCLHTSDGILGSLFINDIKSDEVLSVSYKLWHQEN